MTSTYTPDLSWGEVAEDGRVRLWQEAEDSRVCPGEWGWECLHPDCQTWRRGDPDRAAALARWQTHWDTWCVRPNAPRRDTYTGTCRPKGTR